MEWVCEGVMHTHVCMECAVLSLCLDCVFIYKGVGEEEEVVCVRACEWGGVCISFWGCAHILLLPYIHK